ncbi:unnamed protein product [Closterium sp. NIES-54]
MRALLPCCMRTLLPCPHALLPCLAAAPPCLPARRALLQPARRALLQPAHRALLPPASRPVAAHALRPTAARASRPAARTSHPAAPRVATCCSPRVAPHCCPAPPCPRALCLRHAPCPATAPYPATAPHTLPCLRHAPAPCPARASTLPCLRHMPFPTSAPRPLPCLRHAPCPVCATRPALPPRHVPCPTCATRQRPALHALAPCPAHASALPAPTPYTVRASAALHIAQRCLALPGCHHSCPARCPALTCPACSRCLRAPALPRAYRQLLLPPAHAPTVVPLLLLPLLPLLLPFQLPPPHPGGGASRARQRKPLSPQQRHEWAIWWGATIGGTCESSPAGSAASGRGGSGGGQQHLGGGGFRGTRTGGVEAPGGVEATSLRACDSASAEAEPEEALYTFTLDSDVSRCFFRDSTAVTLLTVPVPVTLAEPSGGPVVARGATVLPCPAAPSGLLTGLHLPSFAKNLVATSVLQDQWVTVTQPGGELVAICTNSHTGEHLATFTQRPGFGLYTLTTESLPPLQRSLALPCLPCVEGRQHAAPHSSSFPPTTAPLQTLHMDVWSPARVTRQGGEHYFLLVVDDNTGAASPTGAGGAGGAAAGGSAGGGASGASAGGAGAGGAGVGGAGARQQETLSPERLREWAVRWGSPGGGTWSARAAGSRGADPGGASAGVPGVGCAGGTGTRGTGASGGTGGAAAVGATAGSPGSHRQEPLSPERLRKWAVHWGSPGGGAGRVGAAGSRGAGPGGTSASLPGVGRAGGTGAGGTSATGGPRDAAAVGAAARNLGSRRQEPLSSERLREWAVHWGSLGGSAAGTGGASPRGASAGVPGGTGTGGTGAARGSGGAGPVGASAVVPRVGSTGGADTGGSTVGTGVGGASRQESLSPQQLREWAVRWGSPSGGAGGTGSGGAVATRAGGSWGATTQPQHSALCRRLSLPPATTETTLAALGFAPSFLRTDTSQPPFYIHVYVDDLVFPTADTKALALVKAELQERHTCTDLYLGLQITRDRARRTISLTQSHMVQQVLQHFDFSWSSPHPTPLYTGHSLSDPPSDESVEPSGPYPEPVGCLMYVMTCTRPNLTYPLSLVAPGSVVLTCHSDASWDDDQTTHRSTQGYSFSLGASSVSWRSTRSSSILRASCEAKIYARAMAAQELHWLTYLLTNLGERPRSPPVLYVNNNAMIALCQDCQTYAYMTVFQGPPTVFRRLPSYPAPCLHCLSSRSPRARLCWPSYSPLAARLLPRQPRAQPASCPVRPAHRPAAPALPSPAPRVASQPSRCLLRPPTRPRPAAVVAPPCRRRGPAWPARCPPSPVTAPVGPERCTSYATPGAAAPGPCSSRPCRPWTQSSRPWPLKQPPLVQPPLDPRAAAPGPRAAAPGAAAPGLRAAAPGSRYAAPGPATPPLDPVQPPAERRPCSPGELLLFPPLVSTCLVSALPHHLPACLPASQPACQTACLPACLSAYLSACLPACLPRLLC